MHTAVMNQHPHLGFSPNPDDTKKQKIRFIYFQTFENRSSLPPNPPFEGLLLPMLVMVGAALAQPPKSSSAATVGAAVSATAGVGAGLDTIGDAPQPAPMSLEVKVSGIFMVLDDEGAGAAGGVGVGSGLLQALPPHGSMLADENRLVKFEDVDVVGAALGAGWGELLLGDRLNTEFRFGAACGGTGFGRGGDVDFVADGAVRSNKSLENDGAGGFGCDNGEEGFL
jgi:hypothetical protein